MRTRGLAALSLVGVALSGASVAASKPIKRTLSGCVVAGVFYSVSDGVNAIATPDSLPLAPFEGQTIALTGWLSPGDHFRLADGEVPVVKAKTCAARSLRLIRGEQAIRLRVDATTAANNGDLAGAKLLIARAIAVVTPPDCDTLTDRAHISTLAGDLADAGKDVASIRKKKCFIHKRMNPLLLQDLGKALLAKGDRATAIVVLKLALANCDGDWCRPDLARELKAARAVAPSGR